MWDWVCEIVIKVSKDSGSFHFVSEQATSHGDRDKGWCANRVLNENVQRLQQQIDNHTGSIDQLHERVDGIEASLTILRAISLIINSHFLISEFYQPSSWDHQMELAATYFKKHNFHFLFIYISSPTNYTPFVLLI